MQSDPVTLLRETAGALRDAATSADALERAVGTVCRHIGWPVGHAYLRAADSDGDLAPSDVWHLDRPERYDVFREVTRATRFRPGVGVVGQVAESGSPAWIADVTAEPRFVRAQGAIGVRAGVLLPIPVGSDVAGVIEFFSPDAAPLDGQLLDLMALVGMQLGECFARERAARLAAFEELAAAVCHAANSPLLAARNALDLLAEDLTGGQTASPFLGIARDELARVAAVMQRLRYLSRSGHDAPGSAELDRLLSA